MTKAMRKGTIVRYIGTKNELMASMTEQEYIVKQRCHTSIIIYKPTRYSDGDIHFCECSMDAKDFEIVR